MGQAWDFGPPRRIFGQIPPGSDLGENQEKVEKTNKRCWCVDVFSLLKLAGGGFCYVFQVGREMKKQEKTPVHGHGNHD